MKSFFVLIFQFFFSKKGRLGRKGFVFGLSILIIIVVLGSSFINKIDNSSIKVIISIFMFIPSYYSFSVMIERRRHDFNVEGESSSLRYHLPVLGGVLTWDELIFREGSSKTNKYGAVPRI